MSWINESNRIAHLKCGIAAALFGTIMCSIGAAIGAEFKDFQYGGKFDFLDILATILGGVIGQIIQVIGWIIIWKSTGNVGLFWELFCVFYWLAVAVVFVICLPRKYMTPHV